MNKKDILKLQKIEQEKPSNLILCRNIIKCRQCNICYARMTEQEINQWIWDNEIKNK